MKNIRPAAFIAALMLLLAGCAYPDAVTATDTEITVSENVTFTETGDIPVSLSEDITVPEDAVDITSGLIYDKSDNTWATDDESMQKFVKIMKSECAISPDIKGTYLLASDDEIIFLGGIGHDGMDENKFNEYTVYEIGSMTKTFTATAVLQLCEQGKLHLDDKIWNFFPEYEKGKDITIYQLLHMQSGIRREFFDNTHGLVEEDTNNEAFDEWKKFYRDGFTDEELLAELFSAEPEFEPGTGYLYSNAGYTLLAMIIEQVTGDSYADYIQANIFDVCGMEHSSSMETGDITVVPDPIPEDKYPFDINELSPTGYFCCPRTVRGCGDIHSCAADILAFDKALINGKLLNEDSLAEMFKAEMISRGNGYCCGWEYNEALGSTYFHAGATHFFRAYNACLRTEKYGDLYLISLSPSAESYDKCMTSIAMAAKY